MAIIIETCPMCGHDLSNEIICTYPPIPRKSCSHCGWSWEGEREEIIRVPFGGNANNETTEAIAMLETLKLKLPTFETFDNSEQSPCDNCSNNPKNGGSGYCNCTLGTPKVIC